MSLPADLLAEGRNDLASSGFRAAFERVEVMVLQAAVGFLLSFMPGLVKVIFGGVLQALADKGIDALVHFTDEELKSLHVDAMAIANQHLQAAGIMEFATPDSDKIHTLDDLKKLHPEVFK